LTLYCMDTSALLHAWNERYPRDHFPTLWTKLDVLIEGGRIISPEEVLHEVAKKGDGLNEWCEGRKHLFVPLDEKVMKTTIEILARFERLVDTKKFRQQADPFVIALSIVRGASVVTAETHRRVESKAPKIPDVCDHYQVPCLSFLDLIRAEGWSF